ncbi:sigma-54-dependent transcriptional regulator [Thiovibrio frasassiensis]|uniref:Sigma-54 dependent transcriptional regulator n=1 Tax=Thiovibrio frasassiensis TaxID=2984131 RepID=A0A9X4MJ66_9BACT|nr:sigma-54 dependent transcriptional regulator [Thiovibrio frasassiensis]MDG4476488.1 sigma-54 dependent transcriptional regulator [Thiovibrio frasassiensis]
MKKNHPVSILVVDDDKTHRIMLKTMLKQWGWQTEEADDGTTAIEAVHSTPFDAILMDVRMTKLDGIEALRRIHAYNPAIPVIIMTAYSSVDAAVEAIKIGAHDYLTKPLDFDRLKLTMARALDHRQVQENKNASPKNNSLSMETGGIIGNSAPMRELLEMVSYVAPSEATVLISGESGTGKELIAAALHHNSARKNGPFIKVNCAALVENLLESELFGHEKGAFTGADRRREGKFVQANGGTIFLDEISETSPGMQAKLLRVLQEHEVQRVGGQETLGVDVRVLAASNRNLEEEVARGEFREDLYYRLNVVPLHVPPLKERREDIPILAEHFVEKFAKKNNRQVAGITPRCMALLINYPWPGNVRELENAIERGIILMRGDYLDEESLPIPVRRFTTNNDTAEASAAAPPGSLEEAEQLVIKNILAETGGNKSEASRRLNITRKTLLSKMHKYGLT